jgi:hypothetical protein
LTLTTTS